MRGASLGRPVEVLLVEDEPGEIRVAHAILKDVDADIWVRISVLHDRDRAQALLRGEPPYSDAPRPDLVLLDMERPGIDAPEVPINIPIAVLNRARREPDSRLPGVMSRRCGIPEFADGEDCHDVFEAVRKVWQDLQSMAVVQ